MICTECGSETKNPKFCSRSCAVRFHNRKSPKRHSERDIVDCINCGRSLVGTNGKKYCSQDCRDEGQPKVALGKWLRNEVMLTDAAVRSRTGPYKKYVLEDQGNRCAICDMVNVWNGKSLTFIFDHIDGNSENNRRDNVRMVCPNCNMQLPTNGSKNKGNGRKSRYLKRQQERAESGVAF